MNIDYTSCDELFELIKQINVNYYERFNANILYMDHIAEIRKKFLVTGPVV